MSVIWMTHTGAQEATLDHAVATWTAPVFAGTTLQRTLVWAHFWGRVDGLAAPFGRALPGLFAVQQLKLDDPDIGDINVHGGDADWITWDLINMDWRVSESLGGGFSTFYNGWLAVDVKSQRTAITDNPSGGVAMHTYTSGGGDTEFSQPTYSCSWAVRQLWTMR